MYCLTWVDIKIEISQGHQIVTEPQWWFLFSEEKWLWSPKERSADSACEIFQDSGGLSINEVGGGAHGKDLRMASRSTWHSQIDNGHPSPAVGRRKEVIMQGRSGVDLCLAASSDGDKMWLISQFQCYTEQRIRLKGVRNDEVIDLCVVKAVNP